MAKKLYLLLMLTTFCVGSAVGQDASDDIFNMSLEELMGTTVISVSKRSQSVAETPAAIYVITQEDIKSSGATFVPELLRMVPGMTVSRISASKWAVSARGFNGRFANKLLVLVDGRTVYSPSFSGVYWEDLDVFLEDVERIEVIRGPGASVWGANAVNGVINIITKHAADTQDGLLTVKGGDSESGVSFRYGSKLAEGRYSRVYVKADKYHQFQDGEGRDSDDAWGRLRVGTRIDMSLSEQQSLSLQAELHKADYDQRLRLPDHFPPYEREQDDEAETVSGFLLLNWKVNASKGSEWNLQGYYDYFDREEFFYQEKVETVDLEFNGHNRELSNHTLSWGLGYRHTSLTANSNEVIQTGNHFKNTDLYTVFFQDELALRPDSLMLTAGFKLEHNDFTGYEFQPTTRLAWAVNKSNHLWVALSKAVRTPSRAETDYTLRVSNPAPFTEINPTPFPADLTIVGNKGLGTEEVLAGELGYRTGIANKVTVDIAAFYNDYHDLRTFDFSLAPELRTEPLLHIHQTSMFSNEGEGTTHGIEVSATWQASADWRLDVAYSYQKSDIDWLSVSDISQNTEAPRHQMSLRSQRKLFHHWEFDWWLRYVDSIEVFTTGPASEIINIDDYLDLDLRVSYELRKNLELSFVAQNLLDSSNLEYIQETLISPSEIERTYYLQLQLSF